MFSSWVTLGDFIYFIEIFDLFENYRKENGSTKLLSQAFIELCEKDMWVISSICWYYKIDQFWI